MKKLRKLPFLLAILVTLFMAACTEADVTPRNDDEEEPPIIIKPTPGSIVSSDTVSIG